MNKKKIGIIALIIVMLSGVMMIFANGIKNKQVVEKHDGKLQIVVTSFPQYDFARAVAGDNPDIQMLIKPGVETHSYEPTPDDIRKIQNSDLFIYNGGENDKWVDGILDSIDMSKTKTLKLEDCVNLIEEDETVGLEGVDKSKVTIAYEPVWAIGPGKIPPDADYIRKIASYVKEVTDGMDVVYGGGLKTDNARMLASVKEIDGGLIALPRFSGEIGFYPDEYLEIIKTYLGY